jgi:hypothetical protein
MPDAQAAEDMEQYLLRSLGPIKPDPQFVGKLRTRLITPPNVVLEKRTNYAAALAIIGIGLFGGVLAVWLLKRLFSRS